MFLKVNQGSLLYGKLFAAYKMGFDYVGCELDKEYFDKGCERFERECHGVSLTKSGKKVRQLSMFEP